MKRNTRKAPKRQPLNTMKSQIWRQVSLTIEKGICAHPFYNCCLVLYEYTNKEYDIVKSAFRPSNYHSLRDLPNDMAPFSVSQSIKERL